MQSLVIFENVKLKKNIIIIFCYNYIIMPYSVYQLVSSFRSARKNESVSTQHSNQSFHSGPFGPCTKERDNYYQCLHGEKKSHIECISLFYRFIGCIDDHKPNE